MHFRVRSPVHPKSTVLRGILALSTMPPHDRIPFTIRAARLPILDPVVERDDQRGTLAASGHRSASLMCYTGGRVTRLLCCTKRNRRLPREIMRLTLLYIAHVCTFVRTVCAAATGQSTGWTGRSMMGAHPP